MNFVLISSQFLRYNSDDDDGGDGNSCNRH